MGSIELIFGYLSNLSRQLTSTIGILRLDLEGSTIHQEDSYVNYEKNYGIQYLKLTKFNTVFQNSPA